MVHYHLAQINVARILAPLDSPVMGGFMSQLEPINALADRSPGFVWRLQTEGGDATSVQAFEDPGMLMNMSVWESVETLKNFVYQSSHLGPLRDRFQWFEKPAQAYLALWWIPAGHIPSIEEACDRLEFRRSCGDSPLAFSFGKTYPAPEAPAGDAASLAVNLDCRNFIPTRETANGDCGAETRFHYRQDGSRVWATYAGGRVRFGSLVAVGDREGRLDMRYHHADTSGNLRTGKCTASPEILPDGRLRLHEEWQRTNGDLAAGRAIVEEIRP
jgi:Domain of unknown function (DUF3291)